MEINKKKYKQAEVVEIINSVKTEYEAKLKEQKSRIFDLTKENLKILSELENYKDKESLINSTAIRAEKNAIKLKEKAELQYALEMERLRIFVARWEEYFSLLKEKYPVYAPVMDAISLKQKLQSVLKLSDAKKVVGKLDKALSDCGAEKVSPKKMISDYISSNSENGFNMDEVLNPGDLELEELCKELGLLDGDE